jgi:MscS family membrane protein
MTLHPQRFFAPTLTLVLALARGAAAQVPSQSASPPPAPQPPERPQEVAADSPRAAMTEFLALTRAGRFDEAGGYLSLGAAEAPRAPTLARRLRAVLDRHIWVDPESLSPLSDGDPTDGLPPRTDDVGWIPSPAASGRKEPVRFVRREDAGGARWAFSRGTVARIEAWYDALDDRWIREYLPEPLLRPGPRGLLWWQWLALGPLLIVAWLAGRILAALSLGAFGRLKARAAPPRDRALVAKLRAPLCALLTVGVAVALFPFLALYAPAQAWVERTASAAVVLAVLWTLWRAVDVGGQRLAAAPWALGNPAARSLLNTGVRAGQAVVLAIGVVAALTALGYPVASIATGVGLGGVALAFAAQKTVENLFGSISIGVDRPFRVGDLVRVEDALGTVEALGLRSTRIRTLDRTLVTIPNGNLAEMRIESLAARDRFRLACTIGLEHATTVAQIRQVLDGMEATLRQHSRIWPDEIVVRLKEIGSSSLDVEVVAWFQTATFAEFQLARQEVLLRFLEVVEKAGARIAFPTRTIHVAADSKPVGAVRDDSAAAGQGPSS